MWTKALALINPASRMPPVGPHQTSTPLPIPPWLCPLRFMTTTSLDALRKMFLWTRNSRSTKKIAQWKVMAQPITSSQKTHREYQNQSPGAMKTMSLKEVSMAISYIESINSDTGVATCFLIGFEACSIDRSSCLVL